MLILLSEIWETPRLLLFLFFFNDTATTEIYTLSLHDALPIRRPLRDHAGAGWLLRGLPPWRRLQCLVRRLGRALRGRLSVAFEHRRLERSTALEGLYPAHPGRSRLPHPEGPTQPPSNLAPARRSRAGSYPRLLSRLRAVEEPGDVAEPRRSR